jgi:hypothetical protein
VSEIFIRKKNIFFLEWPKTDSRQKKNLGGGQILQVQKSMVFFLVLCQIVNKVNMFFTNVTQQVSEIFWMGKDYFLLKMA